MSAIQYDLGSDQILTLTIDMPGQSANTMNGERLCKAGIDGLAWMKRAVRVLKHHLAGFRKGPVR